MTAASCRIDIAEVGGATVVTVSGAIDERTDLVAAGHNLGTPLVVDLAGIEFINSDGVVEWVKFLRAAVARGPVTLRACSEPMVTLFNMVSTAVDGADIASIAVPYWCPACDAERSETVEITDDARAPSPVLPRPTCSSCGGVMDVAGLADRYLAFLRST